MGLSNLPKSVYVLIDFDNYIKTLTEDLDETILELEFKNIFLDVLESFVEFESVCFRLYGGWFMEGTQTDRASKILQLLSNINLFPFIKGRRVIKGRIELASTILNVPDLVWENTLVERDGIPRLRINQDEFDDNCDLSGIGCPAKMLYSFTKHKNKTCGINGCAKVQKQMFKAVEQKMVDTMIVCDIISIANDEEAIGVYIVSDDSDYFPAVALASTVKKGNLKIKIGMKNQSLFDKHETLFESIKVETKVYE